LCAKKRSGAGVADHRIRHARRLDPEQQRDAVRIVVGRSTNRQDATARVINESRVGTVNMCEVPGSRIELVPFGDIEDSGLGDEDVQEAMKSFTNPTTFSLTWES